MLFNCTAWEQPVQVKGKWVIWPSYIDAKLKRREGRRVSRREAVDSPTAEAILDAARKLGYECELDAGAAYPARWYRREGRVFVEAREPKIKVIRKICRQLRGEGLDATAQRVRDN